MTLSNAKNSFDFIDCSKAYGRRMNQKRLLCMLNPLYSLQPADRGLLISLAVSLVFILLLRFTAGLLLWTTIISVVLLLAYGETSGLRIVST